MTVTQCNPNKHLESIVRTSPASPARKIEAVLMLRGESMVGQAVRLGYHRVYLSRVINGKQVSDTVKTKIAQDLGVSVGAIWPEGQAA